MHVAQIRFPAGSLRRAHAQEVHVPEVSHLGERVGELEPARLEVLAQQRLEARLEERNFSGRSPGQFLPIYIDREHLVAKVRHADRVGQAEVADPDGGDTQRTPGYAQSSPALGCIAKLFDGGPPGAVSQENERNRPRSVTAWVTTAG